MLLGFVMVLACSVTHELCVSLRQPRAGLNLTAHHSGGGGARVGGRAGWGEGVSTKGNSPWIHDGTAQNTKPLPENATPGRYSSISQQPAAWRHREAEWEECPQAQPKAAHYGYLPTTPPCCCKSLRALPTRVTTCVSRSRITQSSFVSRSCVRRQSQAATGMLSSCRRPAPAQCQCQRRDTSSDHGLVLEKNP